MGWLELSATLERRQQEFDSRIALILRTAEQRQVAIHCRTGCGHCCTMAVNCSFPEAVRIAHVLTAGQRQNLERALPLLIRISREAQDLKDFLRRFRRELGCPFLDSEQRCTIYPVRPFSCRALLSTRPGAWCGVDFSELHPLERQAFLSSLDRELVNFPTHYLALPQEIGQELEVTTQLDMRDACGVSLSGSMIYQIWLELEHGLSEQLVNNSVGARDLLVREQQEHPYLLQLAP
ncbi:MAG: zinc/iron-chelating domain-containing protein [Desulfuromonas sp.]|nr:MAG: zinc/iron-chelating domain-containing protein [Desulfuromonas sp.]